VAREAAGAYDQNSTEWCRGPQQSVGLWKESMEVNAEVLPTMLLCLRDCVELDLVQGF